MWGYVLIVYNDVCDIHFVYGVHVFMILLLWQTIVIPKEMFSIKRLPSSIANSSSLK